MLYSFLRPLLFRLDPEDAHRITLRAIGLAYKLGALKPLHYSCPRHVMGITFPNPIGLAAGLDKNGEYLDALSALGFGFIEIGTVTPRPQPGNPLPRLFRIPEAEAIINRMGFNNKGVDALVENIRQSNYTGILGINIGKNFDTPIEDAAEDYLICLSKVYPYASYITINISSPNTQNLRQLQSADALDSLLAQLKSEQQSLAHVHNKYSPIAVKIAPDLNTEQIATIAQLLKKHHVDGIIATNTTLSRQGVAHLALSHETGGLSGAPLTQQATSIIQQLQQHLHDSLPIIGVGGIMSATHAKDKFNAGASLIQVYSGLVYQGPDLVSEIANEVCNNSI